MGTPGPSPEVTLDDALGVFTNLDRPSTPLTASEVAEELNCTRRTAHRKLEELGERGDLETKKTGAHSRVWWRPADAQGGVGDAAARETANLAEFGNFVTEVEDYAIFTLEPDGTVATWNEGARQIKGFEESEIVGEHFSTFYTEEDVEASVPEENLAGAKENGRIEDEGWRVRADGTRFWANVIITAIRDDDGELQGFTKVTRDMTERREYEQRLHRERERTRNLLETAPIPIDVQNEAGEVVMANERAAEAQVMGEGSSLGELLGDEEWSVLDAAGEPVAESELPGRRVRESGDPVYEEEILIEDPDGNRSWFSFSAAPFAGPENDGEQVVVAAEEITELKRRELALETELSEVFGRVSDAFYALDDEWQFTHVNDRAEEVLQHDETELLGTTIWEAFPDVSESTIGELFRRALDTQDVQNFTEYYEDSDRWLEFSIYPSETGLSVYFQDVTERKEREQELAKYGTIVETMNDGIYVKNHDGRFTMVNDAYAEMTGYDREELLGAHASMVVDEAAIRESRSAIEGEEEMPVEAPIETADGDVVEAEGTFATLASGEEVGVVRDVTERKQRERALERYERIVENVPVGVYRNTPGPDGEFVEANQAVANIFGAESVEELLEHNVSDLYTDSQERAEFSQELEEEGIVVDYEIEQETLDGETIWISVTAIRTEEDGDVYFDGIVQDITERREYERELEQYEVLFTESRDVSGILDPDGVFTELTPSVAGVLGYEREELVGENAIDYVHPDDREQVLAEFGRLTSDPDAEPTIEYRFRHADGHWVYLESRGRNLMDDPIVEGAVVYSRDITERWKREQQLQERERQLSTLMDNVPGMVYRCRNERGWPMEFVSEGCRDLTGYEPEPLEDGAVSYGNSIVHEEDRESLWQDVQQQLEADGTFLVTYRIVTEDGDVRWVRERGRRVDAEDGTGTIEGVVIDVTERKQLESELDEVFGRVTDAFFALDENWEFTYLNEKAESIVDQEGEGLEGENIWEAFPDALGRAFQDKYERAMYEQETVNFEEYYPEPLDAWFEVTAYPSETGLSVYFRDITEQKEAQQQLEEERDMFAKGPAVVFRWGTDAGTGWPVEYVSENVEEVLGYAPEELQSDDVAYTDLLLEEDLGRIDMEVEAAVDSGAERFTHEPYRIRTSDGDVRWVKDITKIVRDDEGRVDHYLGYLVDITERKESERELEQYETIVETVEDGIYVVDEDGQVTLVNEAYADMLGYDREELLGEHTSLVVDGETRQRAREIETALSDGESDDPVLEAELETASGDTIPAEATFSVLPASDGERRRIGVARDVSDRIEYQRELERKERRYQAVFEDPNILVGLLEPDGTVLDINDTAMEYVDAELEDLVGEQFSETPWWESDDGVQSDVAEWVERAAAGEYVDFEADLTRSDGERYVLSGYFRPVTDDDGEVVSIIVSDRDVTEQKEYQRELERSEQRYRTVVENFPNGAVALVDEDLRYQTLGGDPADRESEEASEIEGKTIREALSPEFADAVEPRYQAALEGESSTFEVDQGDTVVQMQTYPVRDDDGEVFAALGMSQDITERVERERYLQDAKSRLEAATEAGAVGTWESDISEDVFVANPSFARKIGVDPDEAQEGISLERFLETVHEADRDRVERKIDEAIETCGEYEAEYRVRNGEGEIRWVVARGHVEAGEDGNASLFRGALTDITERKEYQRRVEESERRYRTLVENFPDGAVGLFDEDLTYTAVGGELMEELGVPRENRIGRNVLEVYPDEIVGEAEQHVEAALDGEANTFETELYDRSLVVNVLPVTDADGDVIAGMVVVQDVTERREAQEELRESEAKFRMISENLEEVVWMTTPDAEEFLYLNPAFEDVWGIDRQELYDEPLSFIDRVHPEDREHVRAEFTSLPEEEFDEKFRILRPDGEERWVRARGAEVHDEDSELTRIVGIGEDVTERVERERELERALDLLEKTERLADVGGWEIDVNTQEVFWTDHIFDILDVDYDEEPPLDEALDMYHDEDQPFVEEAVEQALVSGDSFDVEVRLGGEPTSWIRLQGDPEIEDGDVVSFRGAAQDVTERVERERNLEDRARQQQAVSDVGQLALETADIDEIMDEAARHVADVLGNDYCKVLDLDDAGEELLLRQGVGWRDGIVGSASVAAHEDDSQAGYTLESDEPVVVEDLESDERFGGPELLTSHDVRSGISTIIGSREEPWGILGTHDTERRSFSEEDVNFVQSVANVLAGAIERHRYQRELEELVDELEESNERLERFAYVASHDLQEPLRMISNYLQLLERRYRDELDDDAEEFIDFAVDGADRMREMIDDLLAYSRLDTQAEPFEPTDADEVVDNVLEDLRLRIEETDAEIMLEDLPTVVADENQLEMVFQNLISNAIKYSGEEPPRVDVGAERRDEEWVFRVEDDGIGMDPEHADDVFEVFKRLHTHEEYPGTGIGLAMCKKIVRHHGGDIWVESEPGAGSTFYFTVPDETRTEDIASMKQIDYDTADGERDK